MFWSDIIDMLRALIFGVAHVCNGSVGLAVILVSLTIRLALLPVTLRLARRARDHQRRLRALQPELERLRKRYATDPAALFREQSLFFRRRGIRQVDLAGVLGGLAQAPVFMALYSTLRRGLGAGIRFLWIGDTSLPNLMLAIAVGGMTAGTVAASQSADVARTVQIMSMLLIGGVTIWFLSSTSALFALSTAGGSAVGLLQGWMIRRDGARAPR